MVIAPAETGFEVEIVGEIAHMIEMGMNEGKKKGPVLNERMARSVKVVAGLEATYTEHASTIGEKRGNRSKSGACNHRELTLRPVSI